jgi:hypothetical protein
VASPFLPVGADSGYTDDRGYRLTPPGAIDMPGTDHWTRSGGNHPSHVFTERANGDHSASSVRWVPVHSMGPWPSRRRRLDRRGAAPQAVGSAYRGSLSKPADSAPRRTGRAVQPIGYVRSESGPRPWEPSVARMQQTGNLTDFLPGQRGLRRGLCEPHRNHTPHCASGEAVACSQPLENGSFAHDARVLGRVLARRHSTGHHPHTNTNESGPGRSAGPARHMRNNCGVTRRL